MFKLILKNENDECKALNHANAVTDLFFLLHFFEGLSLDGSSGSLLVEIFVINRRFVDSEKDIQKSKDSRNIFLLSLQKST
jgi:hypothetical protein